MKRNRQPLSSACRFHCNLHGKRQPRSSIARPVTPPKVTPYHPAGLHLNLPTRTRSPPTPSCHTITCYYLSLFGRRRTATAISADGRPVRRVRRSQGSGSGSVHGRRFVDKLRGEAKVIIGKIKNKKVVERGNRILQGED